jgi:hypothetical protein
VDHVPSWTDRERNAFALGYLRGAGKAVPRDLLFAVNGGGGVEILRKEMGCT